MKASRRLNRRSFAFSVLGGSSSAAARPHSSPGAPRRRAGTTPASPIAIPERTTIRRAMAAGSATRSPTATPAPIPIHAATAAPAPAARRPAPNIIATRHAPAAPTRTAANMAIRAAMAGVPGARSQSQCQPAERLRGFAFRPKLRPRRRRASLFRALAQAPEAGTGSVVPASNRSRGCGASGVVAISGSGGRLRRRPGATSGRPGGLRRRAGRRSPARRDG
jgi:hypothetical protein